MTGQTVTLPPHPGASATAPPPAGDTVADTAWEAPPQRGPGREFPVLSSTDTVTLHLGATISLDVPRDTVHVEIDGNLTGATRVALLGLADRIRQLRTSSHIRVHLGHAAFVESAALAGLRTDLENLDAGRGGEAGPGRGVSLETRSSSAAPWSRHGLSGLTFRAARLDGFTNEELLTASDFVFAWLDDAAGCPGTNVQAMLELYEHIGLTISTQAGAHRFEREVPL